LLIFTVTLEVTADVSDVGHLTATVYQFWNM